METFLSLSSLLCGLIYASVFSTPASAGTVDLPSYPLAVKSPYLSTWVPGNQVLKDAATAQPQFWTDTALTWPILARVGGTSYALFGDVNSASGFTAATTKSVSYTSTHTYITVTAGTATFVLDFFSPILPGSDEYAEHALPYSYLTVNATSTSSTSIQVLTGIDYTWTAQGGASSLNYTTSGTAGFWWFYNSDATSFTEDDDMATWGSVLFGTTTGTAITRGCATASTLYSQFSSDGTLTSSTTCSGTALAAFAADLGTVSTEVAAVTFTVGFDRVEAIDYLGTPQTGYYRSKWSTVASAVSYVLSEYKTLASSSLTFDSLIRTKAEDVSSAYGSSYADIVEASVRQAFGALEITVPLTATSNSPYAFLKEISSDGDINTVDLIFQSWPIFISLNPDYLKLLFEPILAYLQTGGWPNPWVVHDLGVYPSATGHDNGVAEEMPIFETSTLFILLYAYQKLSGDTSLTSEYKTLLVDYADWLAGNNTLYPVSQLVSVDAITAQPNQTALAVQSAIGLNAASILLDNSTLKTLAESYVTKIYDDGLGLDGSSPSSSTHFTYYYGQDTTWNVLFASYSDVVLDLDTFPSEAWSLQSSWYASQIQSEGLAYAGPVTDTAYDGADLTWGLSDWNIMVAAVSSTAVEEAIVNTTHTFLTNGLNTIPFGTKYYVEGSDVGEWISNKARSTVGTNFAILALSDGLIYTG